MPITPAPDYDRSFLASPLAARADVCARQILNILTGGHPTADAPYSLNEIKLAYGQIQQEMQGEIVRLNAERLYKDALERVVYEKAQYHEDLDYIYKLGGTSDDHIVTLLDWPVLLDPAQQQYYSVLPDSYVNVRRYQNLPGEEQVKSVEPMLMKERRKRRYIPLAAGQERLVTGLQGNFGYYRKGANLWYYGEVLDKTLKIDFTLRPTRDQLPLPGLLQDAQDDMIIPRVVAMLMRKVTEDKIPDNKADD